LSWSRIKGIRTLKKKNQLFEIYLGKYRSYNTYVVVETQLEQLNYGEVLKKLVSAIDDSVHKYPSETRFSWLSKKKPNYCFSKSTGSYCIFPSDLQQIGNSVLDKFQQSLSSAYDQNLICWLLFTDSGQSTTIQICKEQVLAEYFLENCAEVIFHIARDISAPNIALFWKKEVLTQTVKKSPNSSYYSSAITGCGNYYFHFDEYRNTVRIIKFYSQIFKHLHREKPQPFAKSEICAFLMQNLYFREKLFPKKIELYKQNLQIVRNLCKIDNCESYARVEVIISHCNLDGANVHKNSQEIIAKILEEFKIIVRSFPENECLFSVSDRELHQHLQNYLITAVNTIAAALDDVLAEKNLTQGECVIISLYNIIYIIYALIVLKCRKVILSGGM